MASKVKWQWSPDAMRWEFWDSKAKCWLPDHPKLPQWFVDAGGTVTLTTFLKIWMESSDWHSLHQKLFWMHSDELNDWMLKIHGICVRNGWEAPEIFECPSPPVAMDWVSEGLVAVAGSTDVDTNELGIEQPAVCTEAVTAESVYDPMQALLRAQSQRFEEPRPMFQTVEGGRFRARH